MESARLEHARVDHNIVTTRGQPNWFVLYRAKMRRLEKEGKPRNTKNKDLHISSKNVLHQFSHGANRRFKMR